MSSSYQAYFRSWSGANHNITITHHGCRTTNLPTVTTTQNILRTMVRSTQAGEEVGRSGRPWHIGPTRTATFTKIIPSNFRIDHGKKETPCTCFPIWGLLLNISLVRNKSDTNPPIHNWARDTVFHSHGHYSARKKNDTSASSRLKSNISCDTWSC